MEFALKNDRGYTALTQRGAHAMRDAHQHMAGQPYIQNGEQDGKIVCVAIAPFDDLNKWIFLNHYKTSNNPQKAIEFYQPPYFDVIAIIQPQSSNELSYVDLRTYLQHIGTTTF